VHHNLCLDVLHLACVVAQANHPRNDATALLHGCMPPACLPRVPWLISQPSRTTYKRAGTPWCSPPLSRHRRDLLRPETASLHAPLSKFTSGTLCKNSIKGRDLSA
jgi:hypothetical protein